MDIIDQLKLTPESLAKVQLDALKNHSVGEKMKLPTDEELKEIVAEGQQVNAIKVFYVFAAVILVLLLSGIGKSVDQEMGVYKQNKIGGAK